MGGKEGGRKGGKRAGNGQCLSEMVVVRVWVGGVCSTRREGQDIRALSASHPLVPVSLDSLLPKCVDTRSGR